MSFAEVALSEQSMKNGRFEKHRIAFLVRRNHKKLSYLALIVLFN